MRSRVVLPLFVCLAIALQSPVASAQYAPRPGGGGTQAYAGQVAEDNPSGIGLAFVTLMDGEALLKSADGADWEALSPNLSLRVGDRVWVQDDARVELRFPMGATAWVNYQSELDVTRLESGSRAETIQVALVTGEATFDVGGFGRGGSVFQVDTPNVSIRASRPARFRVNTLSDGTAQVGVISGSLVLETPDGLTDVVGGRMAEVQPDQRIMLDFLPVRDDWDSWVGSRAAHYDRPAASSRYLPAELTLYAHEFDTSGRWVNDQAYGSVWVPAVERGWSPYSNGRWVWQANDYVWLGYDPWYAPFHYGRWSWGANLGWFWIVPRERPHWSPGYVGWSIVGDEVSWVPLGHNEVYYGYGNYGPGSVNVTRMTNITITNVYVNSRVNNGVVVVRRDNFLRGRVARERIVPSRNPFERGGGGVRILGRSPAQEIKPTRETRQSRPDAQIKRASLPPARVDKEHRTIKTRVVAPTKDKSAFRPGNKPRALKNIVKEKQLEQAPPAAGGRETQLPAGKRRFKRILEPRGAEAPVPAPAVAPAGPGGERERQVPWEGRDKEGERGQGRRK